MCFFCAEQGGPAVDEPVWVGKADGVWEGFDLGEERFALADGAAEESVDEPANAFAGGVDGFIDSSVLGEVHDEELEDADAEVAANLKVYFTLTELRDPVVEESLVADAAYDESVEEVSVFS